MRRELVAQVPQKPRHAGMRAQHLGAAEDEPAVRRAGDDAKRRAAGGDDQAACIGLDRAFDIPKAERSGKNVSEHPVDSMA